METARCVATILMEYMQMQLKSYTNFYPPDRHIQTNCFKENMALSKFKT